MLHVPGMQMEDDAIEETKALFNLFVNLCFYYHNSVHKLILNFKLVDIFCVPPLGLNIQ